MCVYVIRREGNKRLQFSSTEVLCASAVGCFSSTEAGLGVVKRSDVCLPDSVWCTEVRRVYRARHSSVVASMYRATLNHELKMRDFPALRRFMETGTSMRRSPVCRTSSRAPKSW